MRSKAFVWTRALGISSACLSPDYEDTLLLIVMTFGIHELGAILWVFSAVPVKRQGGQDRFSNPGLCLYLSAHHFIQVYVFVFVCQSHDYGQGLLPTIDLKCPIYVLGTKVERRTCQAFLISLNFKMGATSWVLSAVTGVERDLRLT